MQEDAELVGLAIQGDQAAFAELYERYFDRVYDFLARMVHDREEAADLAQDTFVRAMNSLPSLSKGGSFKSWLFTIARNTALNRLERSSRVQPLEQRRGSSDEDDEVQMDVIDEDRYGNPEEAAELEGYAALVWEAAKSLDAKQYAVLDLSVRQQFTTEEMAEALGVSKNNAYVMVNRMKAALAGAIGALALLRDGRRQCSELNAALEGLQVGEMTPDVRKAVDRHAAKCSVCSDRRDKLASPFGVFAGLAFVGPAYGIKESIFESVSATYAQTYGAGASQASVAGPSGERGDGSGAGAAGSRGDVAGGVDSRAEDSGAGDGNGASEIEGGGAGAGGWRRKLIAAGVAAVLLLGGALLTYALAFDNDTKATSASLIEASPGGAAGATTETGTPEATASASATALGTAAAGAGTPPSVSPATSTPGPGTASASGDGQAGTSSPTPDPAAAPPSDGGPPLAPNGGQAGGGSGEGSPSAPGDGAPSGGSPDLAQPPASVTSEPEPPSREPDTVTPDDPACRPSISVDPTFLFYGVEHSSLPLTLVAGDCEVRYTIAVTDAWILPVPALGVVPVGAEATVTVRIDRRLLAPGLNTGTLTVDTAAGAIDVEVQAEMLAGPLRDGPDSLAPRPTSTQPSFQAP